MTEESKAVIIAALTQYRGDDYERARAAFRRRTAIEMEEQYGQSGRTCQQILEGYYQHVRIVEQALSEVSR